MLGQRILDVGACALDVVIMWKPNCVHGLLGYHPPFICLPQEKAESRLSSRYHKLVQNRIACDPLGGLEDLAEPGRLHHRKSQLHGVPAYQVCLVCNNVAKLHKQVLIRASEPVLNVILLFLLGVFHHTCEEHDLAGAAQRQGIVGLGGGRRFHLCKMIIQYFLNEGRLLRARSAAR